MSIATEVSRNDYVGNGSVSTYNYSFNIFTANDLLVTKKDTDGLETTLALTTDYTVTGVGNSSGGTITLVAGNLATNHKITIRRKRSVTQATDFKNQGSFNAVSHENAIDHNIMVDQQQQDELNRSLKVPETVTSSFDPTLPGTADLVSSAKKIIRMNGTVGASAPTGFELGPTAESLVNTASVLAAAQVIVNASAAAEPQQVRLSAYSGDFSAAITAINGFSSTLKKTWTLIIDQDSDPITSDITVGYFITIKFIKGHVLDINSTTATITVKGRIEAGQYPIVDLESPGYDTNLQPILFVCARS